MSEIVDGREKPDAGTSEVDGGIEFLAVPHGSFPTAKESSPTGFVGSIDVGILGLRAIAGDRGEFGIDFVSNRELGLPVLLAVEAHDTANDAVDGGRLAWFERKASVDMEGTNTGEVGFNCLGLKRPLAEGGYPFENSGQGGKKVLAGSSEKVGAELDEVNI
ncbi:hypothetical protein B0H11DRAFT_1937370 [Mycena galericulata]|nr:hypothetical protein B0H11DRAFT_1937370 [Mycena galericulata]